MSISRLYDFTPNTTILSSEVDNELNQLVSEVNLMLKKNGSEAMTGDLNINKSDPAVIFTGSEASAKTWRIQESAGLLEFEVFDVSYLTQFAMDYTNLSFDPGTTIIQSLGRVARAWKQLVLDNGATDGGAILFDADATAFLKAIAAGTQLQLGSKFTSFAPQTTNIASLGDSSLAFTRVYLTGNIGSGSTPDANALYSNLIPKAWASVTSGGTISDGVNLSVSLSATGEYAYTFARAMANANYAVVAMDTSAAPQVLYSQSKTTAGFEIHCVNATDGSTKANTSHQVIVLGDQ